VNALTLDVVREADNGGLRHLGVGHQRAFDLRRAHAVAGDVQHVVHAAGDPVIPVPVAAAAVAGEVFAGVGAEIGLEEAGVVSPQGAGLTGPTVGDDEV